MHPLITVYLVNHNYRQYIKKSIDSVLNQNFDNYELIIIDDGSIDNSSEIIEQYRKYPKIRIIYQQNKGLNVTNNIAVKASRGKYIMRLDADDYLDSNALLIMSKTLNKNGYGLVFPDYYLVDENDNIISTVRRHDFKKDVTLYDQPAHGACTMIRKDCLLNVSCYSSRFKCQDGYDLWLKFMNKYKICNINLPLFYYRQHNGSLTKNESNILYTRRLIKKDHAKKFNIKVKNNVCIIPIRGMEEEPLALKMIGGKHLVDLTLNPVLCSETIGKIIVTTPDERILDYLRKKKVKKNLILDQRPKDLAKANTFIEETLLYVTEKYEQDIGNIDTLTILYIEYPLRSHDSIDEMVNTLYLFEVDCVEPVRIDDATFYKHNGAGLVPINGINTLKLERDCIYRVAGGMRTIRGDFFRNNKSVVGGKIGHIVVDEKCSVSVATEIGRKVAEIYLKGTKGE